MWIERTIKQNRFLKTIKELKNQVLIIRGARQVGKTSFILECFKKLGDHPQVFVNLLYPSRFKVQGLEYFGRDFFGRSSSGQEFLENIEKIRPHSPVPVFIFIDEVDHHPVAMETVQSLASASDRFKFVFTGSNLENIPVKNAATGRKHYFDLYPISFSEFLSAWEQKKGADKRFEAFRNATLDPRSITDYFHALLTDSFMVYLRLGGIPRLVDTYLEPQLNNLSVPELIKDLAISIEENVKAILGEKTKLYEYEDILRKLAYLSMNTLKYSGLQVQHAGKREAQKLVSKTVGARVAHKIRLHDLEKDLSKYILFDCGFTNYLLNGSDLLNNVWSEQSQSILYETFVGNELIHQLITRDDLCYWKSGNQAELEYCLRSRGFIGIDVKSNMGRNQSLNSFSLLEKNATAIVKICNQKPELNKNYIASLPNLNEPNFNGKRKIPLITIPHYLTGRMLSLLEP